MELPNHLIIVCGHAIWAGGPTNGIDESEWIMESWKKGETPTYTEHIKTGLKLLSEHDRAVLMFSGGPTASGTPLSEARSYANLAAANSYWGILPPPFGPTSPHPRILVEERALDSYQNILFSIIHFWRAHAHWPARLTIVSHAFKRRRLAGAHCAALSFPADRVAFVGINPPGVPAVVESEERAVDEWLRDPCGQSDGLKGKRARRNPWGVAQTLFLDQNERARSGIATTFVDGGKEEVLVDGGWRPWGKKG